MKVSYKLRLCWLRTASYKELGNLLVDVVIFVIELPEPGKEAKLALAETLHQLLISFLLCVLNMKDNENQ